MTGMVAAIETAFDGMVHPAARANASTRQRHRAFIASHMAGGLVALAAVPVVLGLNGAPSAADAILLAWLGVPVLVALFLARTGRFAAAHLISGASFTGLVAVLAVFTGGIASAALAFLVVVPIEAALSGDRRIAVRALIAPALALAGLAGAGVAGAVPAPVETALGPGVLLVGAVTAIAYAASIAIGLERLDRDAEAARRASEERYRLLADNAGDLITRHSRSGNVLFASNAAIALAGVAPERLTGEGLFERVHVADRPAFLSAFADAARAGTAATVAFRLRRDEAEGAIAWRWVELRCRPVEAHSGVELVAVTRDVEERKRHEEALEVANASAERANDAKTRFLANMSHELRTPLNAIIGFSEMMTHESFKALGEDRVAEYAGLINESGRHLLDLVNGILDMSKIETGSFDIVPEPFDLRPLITSTLAMMQPAADKVGIVLLAELPANAPEVVADRRACKQIYLNLLSNAVKFSDRGGRVTAGLSFDAGNVYLSVSDTGIGIAEADLPRLATPFVQAQNAYDRRYDGTGLGLSLVKGLARLHQGDLLIRSRLGKGTTVTVKLPIDCEAARAASTVTTFPTAGDLIAPVGDERRRSVA